MPLEVTTSVKRPGVVCVSPSGSINADTYSILEEKVEVILSPPPDVILFDMAGVEYINSMGIRVLLKTKKALKATNGKMAFMNLQPQIQKVFDILKAIPTPEVFADMGEFDEYLDLMQKSSSRKF